MITSPREEEKMMEEWSKSDIARRVRWVNDLAEQRGCEKWTGQTIPDWWLEKIAQARQEERDRIWAESNTPEKTFGITDKNDIGGAILLSDLRTIIFNTQEHGK